MNSKNHHVNRPILIIAIGTYVGIIGGEILSKWQYFSLVFIIMAILVIGSIRKVPRYMSLILMGICFGMFIIVTSDIGHDKEHLTRTLINEKEVEIQGDIIKLTPNEYYTTSILNNVVIENIAIKSNAKVSFPNDINLQDISIYDNVTVVGKMEEIGPPMNPSDFDNEKYLLGENVSVQIKAKKINNIVHRKNLVEVLRDSCSNRVDLLFDKRDYGIMKALIMGEDSTLDSSIDEVYTKTGMGHVLCISGFHVGIIMGAILWISSQLGATYYLRYIVSLCVIWTYAIFTELETSTLRATIMITIFIFSRLLWEEEDGLSSLALSSLVILFINPYDLFMPGFQLSFLAVGAVIVSSEIITRLKVNKKLKKWHTVLLPWLLIQLVTYIPISYNFYNIPFTASIINFIAIPVFSLLLIAGWICIGLSFFSISLGRFVGNIIIWVIECINIIANEILKLPLSTICTGRPSIVSLIVYSLLVTVFVYGVGRYFKSANRYKIGVALVSIALIVVNIGESNLEMALLYIGQGDSTVILTPDDDVIVIDGGKPGKGKVIKNYLSFRGETDIDVMILSHSDSDHIGGLMDLVNSGITIGQIVISKYDESDLLKDFKDLCQDKGIKITPMSRYDKISIGEVNLTVLSPFQNYSEGNTNDNSLVCYLEYMDFKALFTGDKSIGKEEAIYQGIDNISVLKVSHHGSRTGTSDELLLKTSPQYAMISCGINNSYGHPHKEVLDMLDENNITYNQTDLSGAITIETNGESMRINKQREE